MVRISVTQIHIKVNGTADTEIWYYATQISPKLYGVSKIYLHGVMYHNVLIVPAHTRMVQTILSSITHTSKAKTLYIQG